MEVSVTLHRKIRKFFLTLWLAANFLVGSNSNAGSPCEFKDVQPVSRIRSASNSAQSIVYCLGYAHARDRLWQMDWLRRMALGRTAEVRGWRELESDLKIRLFGLARHAQRIWIDLDSDTKAFLESYSSGVNAAIADGAQNRFSEFSEYGYVAEAWKSQDSIALIFLQSLDQTAKTFADDLKLHQPVPKRTKIPWFTSILREDEVPPPLSRLGASSLESESNTPDEPRGSNSWVIRSGGSAILANDPHLELTHPSFWYLADLRWKGGRLFGVSVPGIPWIASGTNTRVAWGITNSYIDAGDVIAAPEDLPTIEERPLVWVRFLGLRLPYFFSVFEFERDTGRPFFPGSNRRMLSWSAHFLKSEDFSGFFKVLFAGDAIEFDRLLSRIQIPGWNFVFADRRGNIGYRAIGKVRKRSEPIRLGANSPENSPMQWLSANEMPQLMNPKRNFIATANNAAVPEPLAPFLSRSFSPSFRAYRIEALLGRTPSIDPAVAKSVQCDVFATDASFFVPKFLDAIRGREKLIWLTSLLESWDYQTGRTCLACVAYRQWMEAIQKNCECAEPWIWANLVNPSEKDHQRMSAIVIETAERLEKPTRPWGEMHFAIFDKLWRSSKSDFRMFTPGDVMTVSAGSLKWSDGYWKHYSGASFRLIVDLRLGIVQFALPGKNDGTAPRDLENPESPWVRWRDCIYETYDLNDEPQF